MWMRDETIDRRSFFGRTRGEIDIFGKSSFVSRRAFRKQRKRRRGEKRRKFDDDRWWIRPASFLGFFPDNLRKYKGSLGGTAGSTLLSPSCQQINVLGLQKRAVGRDFRRGPTNTFLKFTLNLNPPPCIRVPSRKYTSTEKYVEWGDKDRQEGKFHNGKRVGILGVDNYERSMANRYYGRCQLTSKDVISSRGGDSSPWLARDRVISRLQSRR